MDITDFYNSRNEVTEIFLKPVSDSFKTEQNKINLSQILYRQLYSTNNENNYIIIKDKVNKLVDLWITNKRLDKLEETADLVSNEITLQLQYYNSIFINEFLSNETKYNQLQYEIDNNPYKQEILLDGKTYKIKDMLASDYQNINTNMASYNNIYNVNGNFNSKRNKIKFYESALYNKNMDRNDPGTLGNNESKENKSYKKYDNNELLNNVSYLRKK